MTDFIRFELLHIKDVKAGGNSFAWLSWGIRWTAFPWRLITASLFWPTSPPASRLLEENVPRSSLAASVQHRDSSREAFLQASVCMVRLTLTTIDFPVSHWLSRPECVCSPTLLGNRIFFTLLPCNPSISFFLHFYCGRWPTVAGKAATDKTSCLKSQICSSSVRNIRF